MKAMRFIPRFPYVVRAVRLTRENALDVVMWVEDGVSDKDARALQEVVSDPDIPGFDLGIYSSDAFWANWGDWIVFSVEDGFRAVNDGVFNVLYEMEGSYE